MDLKEICSTKKHEHYLNTLEFKEGELIADKMTVNKGCNKNEEICSTNWEKCTSFSNETTLDPFDISAAESSFYKYRQLKKPA